MKLVPAVLASPKSRIFSVQSAFTTILLGFKSFEEKDVKQEISSKEYQRQGTKKISSTTTTVLGSISVKIAQNVLLFDNLCKSLDMFFFQHSEGKYPALKFAGRAVAGIGPSRTRGNTLCCIFHLIRNRDQSWNRQFQSDSTQYSFPILQQINSTRLG